MSCVYPRPANAAVPPQPPPPAAEPADLAAAGEAGHAGLTEAEKAAAAQMKREMFAYIERHLKNDGEFLSDQELAYASGLSELLAKFDVQLRRSKETVDNLKTQDEEQRRRKLQFQHVTPLPILEMSLRDGDVASLMHEFVWSSCGTTFTIMLEMPDSPYEDLNTPMEQLKGVLSEISSSYKLWKFEGPLSPGDIIDLVLEQWHEWYQTGAYEIPYKEHVESLLGLVKECHRAETEEERYNTACNLTKFVVFNSCCKILRRLEFGVRGLKTGYREENGQRWLFDILTTPIRDFPERAHRLPCVDPTPTPEQSVNQHRMLVHFWTNQGVKFKPQTSLPMRSVYDVEGRKLFHGMLSKRLLGIRKQAGELIRLIHAIKANPTEEELKATSATSATPAKEKIKFAVYRLSREIRGLSEIHLNFEAILYVHLKWLSQVTGATSAYDEPDFGEHINDSNLNEKDDPASSSSPVRALVCTNPSSSAMITLDDEELEIDNQGDPRFLPKDATPHDQWAMIAKKYLLQISDHDLKVIETVSFNAEKRSPEQKRRSNMIDLLNLHIVTVRKQRKHRRTLSLNECLDRVVKKSLKAPPGREARLDRRKLQSILHKMDRGQSKQLPFWKRCLTRLCGKVTTTIRPESSITPHHEASAMALAACLNGRQMRENIIKSCTEGDVRTAFDFEAKRFISLRHLWRSLPQVQFDSTRRCCPACWIMVRIGHIMQVNVAQIPPSAEPGYHTLWEKIELPIWTPRAMGEDIIKEMELEAFAIMGRVQTDHDGQGGGEVMNVA